MALKLIPLQIANAMDLFSFVNLENSNEYRYFAVINGAHNSAYEGHCFVLRLDFSTYHPRKPIIVHFEEEMYNPFVLKDGRVCMSSLEKDWSPASNVEKILLSIESLLSETNFEGACNQDVLEDVRNGIYQDNLRNFLRKRKKLSDVK